MSGACGPGPTSDLIERFRQARCDGSRVVLEGLHAVKHAVRFGADVTELVTTDHAGAVALARDLAPDVAPVIAARLETVPPAVMSELAPRTPPTDVVALARRPVVSVGEVATSAGAAPVVVLDHPRHLGNVGAAVRVAAAAGAAGLIALGNADPWHPEAIRGGAGLQFALPVAQGERLPPSPRPVVAVEPGGSELRPGALPARALLAFGGERRGLTEEVRARATTSVGIAMTPGVSSLNLATAVAVVLYLGRPGPGGRR